MQVNFTCVFPGCYLGSLNQLITRVVTNSGTADGATHYVHDRGGNVIAELDASGATAREYIWLLEADKAENYS